MAQRIEKFTTVAAAGVTNQTVVHSFLDGTITRVELYVPDGHAGFTEWSFWYGTAQIIPKTASVVIVANDEQFAWDIEDIPTGTSQYASHITNSDVFAHRFHVQVWLDELEPGTAPADQLPVLIIPFA